MAKTKAAIAPKLTEPGQPAPVVDQRFETEQARRCWIQFDRITYVEGNGPDAGTLHMNSGWGNVVEVEFWIEPKGAAVEMSAESWNAFKERVDRITINCQRMLVFESFELTYSVLTTQPQTYHKLATGCHKLRAIETIAMDGSFNTFIIEASKKLKLQGLAIAGYFNEWRDSYRPSVS